MSTQSTLRGCGAGCVHACFVALRAWLLRIACFLLVRDCAWLADQIKRARSEAGVHVACCLVHVVCCMLSVVCCPLHVACCMPCGRWQAGLSLMFEPPTADCAHALQLAYLESVQVPHLPRDWARPSHICTETGRTPPTSAQGLAGPIASASGELTR